MNERLMLKQTKDNETSRWKCLLELETEKKNKSKKKKILSHIQVGKHT